MKLGLYGINVGACAQPDAAVTVAVAAEEAGVESLWTAEHIVLPDPQVAPSPSPPEAEFLDPVVSLAYVAARTTRIRLATGIVILPQRNPVVLAKEYASLDRLSGGRLLFGVAAGYLEPEFDALGVPFSTRGARTDEFIEAIRTLWTQERPSFRGETVEFSGIQSRPLPTQDPHPPIIVGGTSNPALRRVARAANGWYGFALDPEATAEILARLRRAEEAEERPAPLGEIEITVTPVGVLDRDTVLRFRDLGVHRLVPIAIARDAKGSIDAMKRAQDALADAGLAE